VQSVIHMILDGVAEAETETNETLAVLRINARALSLSVTRSPDCFPEAVSVLKHHGFTLSSFGDENRFLDLMTEPVLRFLSDTFHVHRGWLSGVKQLCHHHPWLVQTPNADSTNSIA
jgi:hypothetical protein